MPDSSPALTETHVWGDDTRHTLLHARHCAALAERHIAQVAVIDAAAPFCIVQTDLDGALVQVCNGGAGRVLLDGRWVDQQAGRAGFMPAHAVHALHSVPAQRWQLCLVWLAPGSPLSAEGAVTPGETQFDGRPLEHAIRGLAHEMNGAADVALAGMWAALIERTVARILNPWQDEPRLVAVWQTVQADLAHDWTLGDLALLANTSEEHLRRLCQKGLGRSPGKQLATLRMAHAAHRLATSDETIEVIARSIGYLNAFAFSNTFKRMTGVRPSDYRAAAKA